VKLLLEVDRHWVMHQLAVYVRRSDFIPCQIVEISLHCEKFNHAGPHNTFSKHRRGTRRLLTAALNGTTIRVMHLWAKL
jgi:hypothetical protein